MKKFRIEQSHKIVVPGEVMLGYLICLFEKALLEFYQVPVIPGKDGDLAIRMGNLTDKAHSILQLSKVKLNLV